MDWKNPAPTLKQDAGVEMPAFDKSKKGGPDKVRPAGFLRRAIAFALDGAILLMLFQCFLLAGLLGIRLSSGGVSTDFSDLGISLLNNFIFIAIGYFTFFHSYCGKTPAKMVLRIEVVNNTLHTPSPLHAFIRSLCYFVSGLFFGLGFVLSLFEGKKRALHDLLTRTQVVLSP